MNLQTVFALARVMPQIRELYRLSGPLITEVKKIIPQAKPLVEDIIDAVQPDLLDSAAPDPTLDWLQTSLRKLGFNAPTESHYGDATRLVVADYQRSKNGALVVDGWAGIKTMASLHEDLGRKS